MLKDTRKLLQAAHALKPIVMIGQKGLTENVLVEIDRALFDHELIKVKIAGLEKFERELICKEVSTNLNAQFVRLVGNNAIFYRKSEKFAKA